MPDTSKYNNYIILRDKIKFNLKGIDYKRVLANDIARLVFFPETKLPYGEIVRKFLIVHNTGMLAELFNTKTNVFSYVLDRNDYLAQVKSVAKDLNSAEWICLAKLPQKYAFNFVEVLKSIFLVYQFFGTSLGFRATMFVASSFKFYLSFHRGLISSFSKISVEKKNYIAFNSAFQLECLLCQFLAPMGVSTFSLCHGFFVKFKNFVPIEIVNGENIEAKNILVWGSSSVMDLQNNFGFDIGRIMIAGNPKYPFKQISVKRTFKRCFVLLGRKLYEQGNLRIVDIVAKYADKNNDVQFCLKLHMSLDSEVYENYCKPPLITMVDKTLTLSALLLDDTYDFAIVNNSTAYYEAMYYDLLCFRYEPDENELFYGLDDKFSDVESLTEKINFFRHDKEENVNEDIERLLVNTLGMGINNYKEILES